MYSSFLGAQVDQIVKELEYYKQKAEEQQEIIEQLTGTGKPKGYVYMHPFDVSELMNRHDFNQMIDVYSLRALNPGIKNEIRIGGRVIRQSPLIPAVTKFIQ